MKNSFDNKLDKINEMDIAANYKANLAFELLLNDIREEKKRKKRRKKTKYICSGMCILIFVGYLFFMKNLLFPNISKSDNQSSVNLELSDTVHALNMLKKISKENQVNLSVEDEGILSEYLTDEALEYIRNEDVDGLQDYISDKMLDNIDLTDMESLNDEDFENFSLDDISMDDVKEFLSDENIEEDTNIETYE